MTAPDAPPSAVVKEMAHRMVDFSGQVHGLAADLSAQEALMAEAIEGLRTLILPGPLPTAGAKALHSCIEGRRKFAFDLLAKIEGRAG